MPLTNLDIPPGVLANGQPYEVGQQGRWRSANLVRWQNGLMLPVGGWFRLTDATFQGACRGLHAWLSNLRQRYLAVGTHTHLYVFFGSALTDITPAGYAAGRDTAILGAGYGYATYGTGLYGTIRDSSSNVIDATVWSMDNWGENLVAIASHEGTVYEWAPGDAVATPVTNAPAGGSAVFVTPERHLVVLRNKEVLWSDRENNTQWTPAATNQAGSFELSTPGRILTALRVRGQTLILTTQDAHTMQFLGAPLVFGFRMAGQSCGAFGQNAAVATDSIAAWMGPSGFHLFDGTVRPLPSDVHDHVFSDINAAQGSKIVAARNDRFGEIWWFYPSANSLEVDRYVIWNYRESHWSMGTLPRTAWVPAGVFDAPIAATAGGQLLQHETGWTASGDPLTNQRWAESGAVSIGAGESTAVVRQMVPDERSLGQTRVRFKTRFFPSGPLVEYGPYPLSARTDLRFNARQVEVRIEGVADADWRIGLPRFDILEGGRR